MKVGRSGLPFYFLKIRKVEVARYLYLQESGTILNADPRCTVEPQEQASPVISELVLHFPEKLSIIASRIPRDA